MAFTSEAATAMAATYLIQEKCSKRGGYDTSKMEVREEPSIGMANFEMSEEPLRISALLAKPLIHMSLWIHHHLRIMCTGESPHIRVGFSKMVAFSSFFYLAVAYSYWLHSCPLMVLLFVGVTITSLFSDSINPSSRLWCSLDRALATSGVFIGPIRAGAFYSDGCMEQLEIVALSLFSIMFLAWSRRSKNQDEFVLRHTCWHAVSASCLVWLAFNAPPIQSL